MDYNGAPSLHYMSHHVHRESANEDKEIRKVFHKQMTKSLTVNYNPINAAHMDENHKKFSFFIFKFDFAIRHEVHTLNTNTLSTQCRLIKTDTTEHFTKALEAEPQCYRHFLNTIVR